MKEIKPTYTTFEQSKLLKEKEFDTPVRGLYDPNNPLMPVTETELTNWNDFNGLSAPQQWQVVEWLRLEHNIFVSVLHRDVRNQPTENNTYVDFKGFTFYVVSTLEYKHLMSEEIDTMLNGGIGKGWGIVYNSPQEAYSSAFDFILKELI